MNMILKETTVHEGNGNDQACQLLNLDTQLFPQLGSKHIGTF